MTELPLPTIRITITEKREMPPSRDAIEADPDLADYEWDANARFLRATITLGDDPKTAQFLGIESPVYQAGDLRARATAYDLLMNMVAETIRIKTIKL